jgi:hypothetical protein
MKLFDDEVIVLFTTNGTLLGQDTMILSVYEANHRDDGILYLLLSIRLKQFA